MACMEASPDYAPETQTHGNAAFRLQDAIRYGSHVRKGNELEALYVSSTWAISAIRRELSGLVQRFHETDLLCGGIPCGLLHVVGRQWT